VFNNIDALVASKTTADQTKSLLKLAPKIRANNTRKGVKFTDEAQLTQNL